MGVLSWTEPAFDWMHKKAATAFTLVRSIQTSGDGRRMCSKDATCTIEMKKTKVVQKHPDKSHPDDQYWSPAK